MNPSIILDSDGFYRVIFFRSWSHLGECVARFGSLAEAEEFILRSQWPKDF